MTEQHPDLNPCPFCGHTVIEDYIFKDDDGFYSVSCQCGCNLNSGFQDLPLVVSTWNERYFSNDQIRMILSSEGRNIHRDKPGFPKIPFIFFWLSGFIFSFAAYLGDSSGLADSLNVFGFFTLLFTIGSALYWADLMRIFEECEETSISKETA